MPIFIADIAFANNSLLVFLPVVAGEDETILKAINPAMHICEMFLINNLVFNGKD
jgi:hypothetical protein